MINHCDNLYFILPICRNSVFSSFVYFGLKKALILVSILVLILII